MPLYRYEALDRTGNKVVGAMQVDSEQALTARLTTMGYQATLVQPAQRSLQKAPAVPAAGRMAPVSPLAAPDRDTARVMHQLFLAFKAGMQPYLALTTVAGQVHVPALRVALHEMAQAIQGGSSLSGAMERFPRLFGPGDVGMVRAAEQGGFLPEALEAISQRLEDEDSARGRLRIWVWFLHSNVLTALLFIPVGWFLKDVFPSLDVRVGLASALRALLFLSLPLSAGYLALVWWISRLRHQPAFRHRWHALLLKLPVTGNLNRVRARAAFTRVLAWLVHAGVSAPSAFEAAAGAVPNQVLAERFFQGAAVMRSQGRFSLAIQATGMLDPSDVGMVATGETTGEIPQALNFLASRYEEAARIALQESVHRAAATFRAWAFLMGILAFALVMWGYFQGAFKLVDGFE